MFYPLLITVIYTKQTTLKKVSPKTSIIALRDHHRVTLIKLIFRQNSLFIGENNFTFKYPNVWATKHQTNVSFDATQIRRKIEIKHSTINILSFFRHRVMTCILSTIFKRLVQTGWFFQGLVEGSEVHLTRKKQNFSVC
jgi:hypothetical protein